MSSYPTHIAYSHCMHYTPKSDAKKYVFWILCFIAYLMLHRSNNEEKHRIQKRAKKLRAVAETIPDVEMTKISEMNRKIELNEKYDQLNNIHDDAFRNEDLDEEHQIMKDFLEDSEDYLEEEVKKVLIDVDMAKEDEIDNNNYMITTAVQNMEESVRYYLGSIFGYENGKEDDDDEDDDDDDDDDEIATTNSADIKLTKEQLGTITKKISEKLEEDAKVEFRAKADSVEKDKTHKIEDVLAEDKKQKMRVKDVSNKRAPPCIYIVWAPSLMLVDQYTSSHCNYT